MQRGWLFCALVALTVWGAAAPARAYAQQPSVMVEHAGADTIMVAPGERGSVAFRFVNQDRRRVRLDLAPEAPAGWRVVALPGLALDAASSSVRVVTFFTPADAAAGVHEVGLVASYDGGRAEHRVVVRVPASPDLRAEVEDAPRWATAGQSYSVRFQLRNAGNVPLTARLRLVSPHGFRARTDTTPVRLKSGATAEVPVVVTPPRNLGRAVLHALRLIAVSEADSAQAVARVEVVPQGQDARPERGGLPAEVRLRGSGDPRAGPPVRVHTAGPLRPGSQTRVEMLLQGPTQQYSVFGETDVYRLRLESPRFSVKVGDDVYRLSRLTEPGQEGLGAGVDAHLGPLMAGGFIQRDRRSFQPDTQYAAFAGVSLGRRLGLRGNWFRRDSRDGRREVASGEVALRVPGWLSIKGEYGWRPARDAFARELDLRGSRGPLTVGLRHLRGDSAFGGTYGGLSLDAANIGLRPWGEFYLEGAIEDQSIQRTSAGFRFNHARRSARVGVGWGSRISLEGQHLERRSRSRSADAEREARSLRLRIGLPLGPVRFYPSFEAGVGQDRLTTREEPFWSTALRTQLVSGPASLSTTVEYFTGGTLHRSVAEQGFSGTASASLRLGSSLRLQASAYGSRYLAPVERDHLVMNGRIEQRLPFGHLVSARVLTRMSSGRVEHRETIALVDYTIPLKLPVGRAPESASVAGRIMDAESRQPLEGVVVRVSGRRIATDAQGRVTVRGLAPGTHYVDIDRSTFGSGRVPTRSMPLRLEVDPGKPTEFEVRMVASGALSVKARLVRRGSVSGRRPDLQEEPLARALLEFRSGEERFRRPTDERGRVELGTLRPGEWTVEVVHADLPPFHRFHEDSVSLTVAPGERAELELIASAVERQMQVIASGELREERVGEQRAAERQEPTGTEAGEPVGRVRDPAAEETFRTPTRMPLWEVAGVVYRDSHLWPKLWVANRERVPDPAAVPEGLELRIPAKAPLNEAERRARDERRQQVNTPHTEPTSFRVPKDMPLWEVAWRVYGDTDLWPKIWVANRDMIPDPSAAEMGLLLKVPPAGLLTPAERRAEQEYLERDVLSLPPRL